MNAQLDTYIADLLHDYDCVIIPQLGGFVTNYRPARIDEKSGTAHPAGKDVRFNRNLTRNDGLLTQTCAQAKGWNFEEANSFIRSEVESYLSKLNGGEKVRFKKIGLLYTDEHQNLRFEPSNDHNFLKASVGFESFNLPPVVVKTVRDEPKKIAEKTEPVVSDFPVPEMEPEAIQSDHSRSIYWVAAATLIPFLGLGLYVGFATDFKSPTAISFADLNPFGQRTEITALYAQRSEKGHVVENEPQAKGFPAETVLFPYSFEKNEVDSTGVWINLKTFDTPRPVKSMGGKYHIIAGCFGEEANAEKFIADLESKGVDATILDLHKDLYRVRIGSYDHYGTALDALNGARSQGAFPNAWLLKKPL